MSRELYGNLAKETLARCALITMFSKFTQTFSVSAPSSEGLRFVLSDVCNHERDCRSFQARLQRRKSLGLGLSVVDASKLKVHLFPFSLFVIFMFFAGWYSPEKCPPRNCLRLIPIIFFS